MSDDQVLAEGTLDGRTWRATAVVIGAFGQPAVAFAFTDAPRALYHASPASGGAARRVWEQCQHTPAVAEAVEAARLQHAQQAEAEQRRAEAHRAHQAAHAEQARREAARLRAEAEAAGRRCYLRFGHLPAGDVSVNHRDGHAENGVSVYPAWHLPGGRYVIDLRGLDTISALFIIDDQAPVYEVTGALAGATGADGEPLLVGTQARRVRPSTIQTTL